ncbi:uncharacterized protein SEPMUDRAFT_23271, partial [Sphaerulina musiva SO2202]
QRVEYLIDLTKPFAAATAVIGTTKGPTIHLVLAYYNKLFDILEEAIKRLKNKRIPWKKDVFQACEAA